MITKKNYFKKDGFSYYFLDDQVCKQQVEAGVFEESGGEFMMVIYAREQGSGWGIYRTDEVTLMEWKSVK